MDRGKSLRDLAQAPGRGGPILELTSGVSRVPPGYDSRRTRAGVLAHVVVARQAGRGAPAWKDRAWKDRLTWSTGHVYWPRLWFRRSSG